MNTTQTEAVDTSKVRQMQMMIHLLLTSGTILDVIYETIYTTQKILKLNSEEIKLLSPIEIMLLGKALEYRQLEEAKENDNNKTR